MIRILLLLASLAVVCGPKAAEAACCQLEAIDGQLSDDDFAAIRTYWPEGIAKDDLRSRHEGAIMLVRDVKSSVPRVLLYVSQKPSPATAVTVQAAGTYFRPDVPPCPTCIWIRLGSEQHVDGDIIVSSDRSVYISVGSPN